MDSDNDRGKHSAKMERKILSEMNGTVIENEMWKIRRNNEL